MYTWCTRESERGKKWAWFSPLMGKGLSLTFPPSTHQQPCWSSSVIRRLSRALSSAAAKVICLSFPLHLYCSIISVSYSCLFWFRRMWCLCCSSLQVRSCCTKCGRFHSQLLPHPPLQRKPLQHHHIRGTWEQQRRFPLYSQPIIRLPCLSMRFLHSRNVCFSLLCSLRRWQV